MVPGDPDLFLKFTQRGSLLSFSRIGMSGTRLIPFKGDEDCLAGIIEKKDAARSKRAVSQPRVMAAIFCLVRARRLILQLRNTKGANETSG